jgi:hypothetical protein
MLRPRRSRLAAAACAAALLAAGDGRGQVAGGLSTQAGQPSSQLGKAMAQSRLNTCAPTVQRAADFLFEGGAADFTLQPLGPDANRWPSVVTIESRPPDGGQTRFSTLVIAPAGSCAGLYQQVIYWNEPCATVQKTVFGAFAGARPLYRDVQVSEANPGLQVYLMPAGKGCVSIKKELLH